INLTVFAPMEALAHVDLAVGIDRRGVAFLQAAVVGEFPQKLSGVALQTKQRSPFRCRMGDGHDYFVVEYQRSANDDAAAWDSVGPALGRRFGAWTVAC